MAKLNRTDFQGKYNHVTTGLFKDNVTNAIIEDFMRQLVTDIADSFLPFRGAFDASVDAYPSAGGSGTSNAIQAGDEWYVSVQGDLDVTGLGVITVYPGALIKALVNAPGTTPANWKVIQ